VSLRYRRAVPADAPAVADLVEQSYAHYVPLIGLRPAPMDADYPSVIKDDNVWVAESADGALVGVIVLALDVDHLVVENLAVAVGQQGTGIGTRLLDIAEDEAAAAGRAEIRLFTHVMMTDNLAYYGRRGYVETHRLTERGFSRVFFSKHLHAVPSAT
jgi:ribosomal protein S18 acetylase RimI-like enzyme